MGASAYRNLQLISSSCYSFSNQLPAHKCPVKICPPISKISQNKQTDRQVKIVGHSGRWLVGQSFLCSKNRLQSAIPILFNSLD